MPWRRRKTGSSRQRGTPFYVPENPRVAARKRAIQQGHSGMHGDSKAKRLKDIDFKDIQEWTEDSFKKQLFESVLHNAEDSPEVRIWLRTHWGRLYEEFLASDLTFEEWFDTQASF